MSFKVTLNLDWPHGVYGHLAGCQWYDPKTGINLTILEPESRTIADDEDLSNIVKGVQAETILVSSGSIPQTALMADYKPVRLTDGSAWLTP